MLNSQRERGRGLQKRADARASLQGKEAIKGIREQDIKIGRRRQDRWRKIVKMTPESEKHTQRERRGECL